MWNDGWIVVAGASRGIGRALAQRLARENTRVVLSARDAAALDDVAALYGPERRRVIPWDFSVPESLEEYGKRVLETAGPVSGMAYCAGKQKTLPLNMSKPATARDIFDLNTFSAIELVRVLSKKEILNPGGASFVLISSLAAHEGAVGKTLYAASKAALEGFVPPAASELAPKRIRLNSLVLGIVTTDMSMEFIGKMTAEQRNDMESGYPLGLGEPNDVASFIRFLLSDESRWITGQAFVADGGHSARKA